jgi:hypothetical protein
MGRRAGTNDRNQINYRPNGSPDKKDLAGASIGLFVERNFIVVGHHGRSSEKEVRLWGGEDSAEYRSAAEGGKAEEG